MKLIRDYNAQKIRPEEEWILKLSDEEIGRIYYSITSGYGDRIKEAADFCILYGDFCFEE